MEKLISRLFFRSGRGNFACCPHEAGCCRLYFSTRVAIHHYIQVLAERDRTVAF